MHETSLKNSHYFESMDCLFRGNTIEVGYEYEFILNVCEVCPLKERGYDQKFTSKILQEGIPKS